ncbi:MAG: peptidase [Candidatus Latescibacteria bacterium]|nr:peptidase [Candidatus Latescibacterota bacterium]
MFVLLIFTFLSMTSIAQDKKEDKAKDSDSEKKEHKIYTVKGYRHGISFFKKAHYKETIPIKEGELDFRHYHTYDEMVCFLKKWAEQYPDLIDLYIGGQSFEGRDIYQLTLTNKNILTPTDKPAMAIDANRHSGEVTAAESALWLLNYLLEKYGKDDEITKLIDTKTFYFRVLNNPDGSEMYLQTVQSNRSSVRPHDSDRDGLLDEDPPEDLDGDGFIRQMRVKAEPDSGNYILDPRDSSGRLMKQVMDGEGEYKIYSEGIDNDGDGKYNEDGIGGLDLHRNYPENWRPDSGLDATERGWTQFGAGEYPLSEPETRSFVLFLLQHPHISIVNSMDTSVPMHLRGPSTSKSEERMYPEDLELFRYFDKEGQKITGYPWAGDTYQNYQTRTKFNPVTGDPNIPVPLFGHGPDFGYWYYGSIWYGDELWCTGAVFDYDKDGTYDEYDALRWNDEACGGKEFMEWTEFDHPQLGKVEIGGFNPKFFRQNPPVEFLEEWIIKQAKHNLFLAKHLPQIEITSTDVKPKRTKGEYEVTVKFTNTGYLPTALQQAQLVKIVRPDRVRLEFDKELTKDRKNKQVEILVPEIQNKDIELGITKSDETKTARFTVKLNGIDSAECTVHVLSSRGGHHKKEIVIGEK